MAQPAAAARRSQARRRARPRAYSRTTPAGVHPCGHRGHEGIARGPWATLIALRCIFLDNLRLLG